MIHTISARQARGWIALTRLRKKPRASARGGMRGSSDLSGEALAKSEALAKEDWSFGGLRGTRSATGSCPWGSILVRDSQNFHRSRVRFQWKE